MTTPFAARAAKLAAAIGRAFGEGFDFIPMKAAADVNLPPIADGSRTQLTTIIGVWEGAMKSRLPHARGSVQDDTAQSFAASAPSVSIADADLAWMPRKFDLCKRRLDGAVYQVAATYSDGMGRTLIKLSAKKRGT